MLYLWEIIQWNKRAQILNCSCRTKCKRLWLLRCNFKNLDLKNWKLGNLTIHLLLINSATKFLTRKNKIKIFIIMNHKLYARKLIKTFKIFTEKRRFWRTWHNDSPLVSILLVIFIWHRKCASFNFSHPRRVWNTCFSTVIMSGRFNKRRIIHFSFLQLYSSFLNK